MAIGAPEVLAHVPAEASGTVIPEGEGAKSCQPLARPDQHRLSPACALPVHLSTVALMAAVGSPFL